MPDLLVRGIDREAGLRIVAAITTDLAIEAARRHDARGVGACALGRGLTAGLLLATLTKGQERLTLQIEADGPLRGVVVDATMDPLATGTARGYLVHPGAATDSPPGRCLVGTALGRHGIVNILRDLGLKDRYQGQVPLVTGEIDEDVESYLRISEQVPSALGCDVRLDGDGGIVRAAGVLVQALPGGSEEDVRPAQHALRTGALFEALARVDGDADPIATARRLAEAVYGRPIEVLGEQPLAFRCRCSPDRVEAMLRLLTTVDLDEMLADPGHAEVRCNFCNERYVVEGPALERIRAELSGAPRQNN